MYKPSNLVNISNRVKLAPETRTVARKLVSLVSGGKAGVREMCEITNILANYNVNRTR